MTQTITPEQQAMIEEAIADKLRDEKDEIAASLGIHPEAEGEWTRDEAIRIINECDSIWRASITDLILSSYPAS